MNTERIKAGALVALAAGVLLHGAAALVQSLGVRPQPVRAQNLQSEGGPPIYYVGRDTYFITASPDGTVTYLWYYDFSPERGQNSITFITSAAVH